MSEPGNSSTAEPDSVIERVGGIVADFLRRRAAGEHLEPAAIAAQYPGLAPRLLKELRKAALIDAARARAAAPTTTRPLKFGRYRVTGTPRTGGFGLVYRGYDDELQREVAIKVPRPDKMETAADVDAYLTEARTVASLRHPGIVEVFDVGLTVDGLCYVVSEFMPGGDLAQLIEERPPSHEDAAELIARVADALHHAHKRGLVHRDIKPGNILLDDAGHPLVADFGLALRDEEFGSGSKRCGTPRYMSPEQARGEGHRVDARSDIYSLGVVFYELLAGRSPYRNPQMPELLDEITSGETRPPRQIDDKVPKELDRICLKTLAKRAADRYSTALDLADDLRRWHAMAVTPDVVIANLQPFILGTSSVAPKPPSDSAPQPAPPPKVVPKGLRSFDAGDADFFLQLLPGPTDRDGLPESIRFWKTRVERTDADTTFSVGLIYGPSGCGKSSLMKAGVVPRLAKHVLPVYLEATPDDTEARLLKGLRKACPGLNSTLTLAPRADAEDETNSGNTLVETLASLRRHKGMATGQKVLIVLDQFEQWLHARRDQHGTELVRALRHCDGGHVQCIVMVRDDFWLAASRFMDSVEIPLVQGQNSALVDLFDTLHARKVLTLFGRAFGRLPDQVEPPTENEQFLDQAVSGLAEDGKVVSVRLSLFAEMVKGKPWTPSTLKEIGGAAGVGATFLEDTFCAATAPPRHRLHQSAARAVLKALLPEAGADIKGHRRSAGELLAASGYGRRPVDFAELVRILDAELRLVTPTDDDDGESGPSAHCLDGLGAEQDAEAADFAAQPSALPVPRFFQLTHDYLVPSLRDWLTRKQKETRRGRAEIRLAERAAAWNVKPDMRYLPSWWEWPNILLFTQRKKWTAPERRVMRAAGRYHGARLTGAVILIAIVAFTAREAYRRVAENVLTASAEGVPYALDNLRPLGLLAVSFLREQLDDVKGDGVRRLHAAYALADNGETPWEFLIDGIATAPAAECRNIIAALEHEKALARPELARRAAAAAENGGKARYAIVALHLGDSQPAKDALAVRSDPTHRTTLIHAYATWRGDLSAAAELFRNNPDSAFRSGLCTAIGTIAPETLKPVERNEVTNVLMELYIKAPDGGTHAAAGWALRQWKQELPELVPTSRPPTDRRWFVNGQGMTMVAVRAGTFAMGRDDTKHPDPEPSEAIKLTKRLYRPDLGRSEQDWRRFWDVVATNPSEKPSHTVTLTKGFYIADREVTIEQFGRFVDATLAATNKQRKIRPFRFEGDTTDSPMQSVSWFDAVHYCNWLSMQENRRDCYLTTGVKEIVSIGTRSHEVEEWLCDWTANGYRLPTEAEWEYVARAGIPDKFCFGCDEGLLPQFAWFDLNSKSRTWPGGLKMPNALGLFDVHGNVREWCWDRFVHYNAEDVSDPTGSTDPTKLSRVVRGGAWNCDASGCWSFSRAPFLPMFDNFGIGFRVLCID